MLSFGFGQDKIIYEIEARVCVYRKEEKTV